MSIWVEVHCDMPLDKAAKDCPIYVGGYPSSLGRSMVVAHDNAVAEAHRAGWVKRSGEWFCPACAKVKV